MLRVSNVDDRGVWWNRGMSSLLVDQQSASVPIAAAELAVWAANQRVFVSSLIDMMGAERAAAREAIVEVGAEPVMFEHDLGGQDVDARSAYIAGVRSSGIYVGVFGPVYGVALPDGDSATESEFREAQANGLRLIALVENTAGLEVEGRQQRFIAGLRNILTTAPYATPADVKAVVGRRLREIAAEQIAPWVKVGDVAVRATSIREMGAELVIVTRVVDTRVRARIDAWRNRSEEVTAIFAGRVFAGRVTAVESLHTSTVATEFQITLSSRGGGQQSGWFSSSSYSDGSQRFTAADLARLALSDSLFGTSSKPGWVGPPVVDLLAPLRDAQIVEGALRPLVELLITEYLIGGGVASLVDSVVLGPARAGRRWLKVTWTPPHVYVNEPAPEPVTVEGDVAGF